jgi:hypothetical protein
VSSQLEPAGERSVFRSTGSVVLWWVWVVAAIAILADLAVQGRDHTAVVMAMAVAVLTGILYGCALRPRVVADASGITVANPLRDHRVPWAAVAKVDVVTALRVHCVPPPGGTKGKILYSWAVQAPPRAARRAEFRARRAGPRAGSPGGFGRYPAQVQEALALTPALFAARQLNEQLQRLRVGPVAAGQPEVRWAWTPIMAMAVPAAALLVAGLA